jgi:hypothetical protein
VLSNGFYHKDQDAQIKKGYAYFSTKRFDLAAREFQNYLRQNPNGRYAPIAREWSQMSTRELLDGSSRSAYPKRRTGGARIARRRESGSARRRGAGKRGGHNDEEVAGTTIPDDRTGHKGRLDNVAEL